MDVSTLSFAPPGLTEEELLFLNANFTNYDPRTKSFHSIPSDLNEHRLIIIAGLGDSSLMDEAQDTLLKILILDPSNTCLFLDKVPTDKVVRAEDVTIYPSLPKETSICSVGGLKTRTIEDYRTFLNLRRQKNEKQIALKRKWEAQVKAFGEFLQQKIEYSEICFKAKNTIFVQKQAMDEWKKQDAKNFYLGDLTFEISWIESDIKGLLSHEEVFAQEMEISKINEKIRQLMIKNRSLFSKMILIQPLEHLLSDPIFYENLSDSSLNFTVLFPNKVKWKEQQTIQVRNLKKREIRIGFEDPTSSTKERVFTWPFPKIFSDHFCSPIKQCFLREKKIKKLSKQEFIELVNENSSLTFPANLLFQFIDFPFTNISTIFSILQNDLIDFEDKQKMLLTEFFSNLNSILLLENKQIYIPTTGYSSLFLDFKKLTPRIGLKFEQDFQVEIREEALITSAAELMNRMQDERRDAFKLLPHQKLVIKNLLHEEASTINSNPPLYLPQFLASKSKQPVSVRIEPDFLIFYSNHLTDPRICIYSPEGLTIRVQKKAEKMETSDVLETCAVQAQE